VRYEPVVRRLIPGNEAILLFLAAFVLYVPAMWWGLPEGTSRARVDVWAPDDLAPLAPMTELYNTFVRASADRYLVYPLFHHFLLSAWYAPYILWQWVTGGFRPAGGTYPFGFVDPVTAFRVLTMIARVVSALMAAGVGMAARQIAAMLWDRGTARLAWAVTVTSPLVVYFARTGNVDVPALFWTALGLVAFVYVVTRGLSRARGVALGCCAALAAATKDQAAAAFVLTIPAALWLGHPRRLGSGETDPNPYRQGAAALFLCGGLLYGLASGFFFDPERYAAHIRYLFSESQHHWIFRRFTVVYDNTPSGVIRHMIAIAESQVWVLGPALLGVALMGAFHAARHRQRAMTIAIPALGHLLLFLLPLGHFRWRFGIPLTFVLGLFAARGLTLIGHATPRAIYKAVVVVGLLWPVTLSANLVYEMLRDSRYSAAAWLSVHARPGDRVAHFNPEGELPNLPPGVKPLPLPPREQAELVLRRDLPELVILQPDWTSAPERWYSGRCPTALVAALEDGSLGYKRSAYFKTQSFVSKRLLDYPSVNPPITIYTRVR
jgi:hypothetical protein